MLENILRKLTIVIGLLMLVASIYLSYDGFDQSVTGGNSEYSILATSIGIVLAIAFTLCEFIVSSNAKGLNSTLKWLGVLAYGYSIYTNYVGLQHLLNMDMFMAIITAAAMDILPEQMIAWGLGEAVMHDLLGNLGKFAAAPLPGKGGGGGGNQQNNQPNQPHQNQRPQQAQFKSPKTNGGGGFPQGKPGQGRSAREAQMRSSMQMSDLSDTDKMRAIRRSFDE